MFGFFKKKKEPEKEPEMDFLDGFLGDYLGPMNLMLSFIEVSKDYQKKVNDGIFKTPIHAHDEEFAFLEIWYGTRVEWLSLLWRENSPTNLADNDKYKFQIDVINNLRKGSFFKNDNLPSNTELEKNIKSISDMYDIIGNICANNVVMVEDKFMLPRKLITDKSSLKYSAYSEILKSMRVEIIKMTNFLTDPVPEMPKTLFELIYKDVTRLSKLLSLTVTFGPNYLENQEKLYKEAEKRKVSQREINKIKQLMETFNNAEDPDDIDPESL